MPVTLEDMLKQIKERKEHMRKVRFALEHPARDVTRAMSATQSDVAEALEGKSIDEIAEILVNVRDMAIDVGAQDCDDDW